MAGLLAAGALLELELELEEPEPEEPEPELFEDEVEGVEEVPEEDFSELPLLEPPPFAEPLPEPAAVLAGLLLVWAARLSVR